MAALSSDMFSLRVREAPGSIPGTTHLQICFWDAINSSFAHFFHLFRGKFKSSRMVRARFPTFLRACTLELRSNGPGSPPGVTASTELAAARRRRVRTPGTRRNRGAVQGGWETTWRLQPNLLETPPALDFCPPGVSFAGFCPPGVSRVLTVAP